MKRWEKKTVKAHNLILTAIEEIDEAAKLLAKSLGFKNYDKFGAVFAGRGETVFITFCDAGLSLELDIETMSEMTKKQVIQEFETMEEDVSVLTQMY